MSLNGLDSIIGSLFKTIKKLTSSNTMYIAVGAPVIKQPSDGGLTGMKV